MYLAIRPLIQKQLMTPSPMLFNCVSNDLKLTHCNIFLFTHSILLRSLKNFQLMQNSNIFIEFSFRTPLLYTHYQTLAL